MRIALAVWNGRISPVFDVSRQLLIVEVEDGRTVNRIHVHFSNDNPFHKVRRLVDMEVEVLLCGATSQQLAAALDANNIRRVDFISGDIETVIDAFLKDALPNPELSMPGCQGRGAGRRRRNQRGDGRPGALCRKRLRDNK